jgi:membrane fusion protein (multidrug efflux system)
MEAIHSVSIQARVEGFLQQVAFNEGQDVHAGDLLYVIEPAQYQAALQSAEAQLQSAQANLTQAERNLARNQELRKHGTIAQATLDQAIEQRDTAAASVTAAQAAVKTAQLNLGYTRITSPIDGRIGATSVTAGNLVGPSSGVLARVVQLDPIRVVFSVNERDLLALKQRSGNVSQQQLNARFVPTLRLADGTTYAQAGRVDFVDNTVDPATGTVAVHAVFPNPQKLLLPGMLVTVTVQPEHPQTSIVVPLDAVAQDRQGKFVLIVDDNDRVQQHRIEVNGQYNQQWIVTAGLREGEEVIVSGLQKVRPGQQVKPVPAEKPVGQ